MLLDYALGQASIVLRVKLRDSSSPSGAGLIGLTSVSAGLKISAIADNEATTTTYTGGTTLQTITTLGTYAAPSASNARFRELDAANHPGVYEVQLANARYGVAGSKSVLVSILGATNLAQCDVVVPLRAVNPYDAARFGLANLDVPISTRLAAADYVAGGGGGLDAAGLRAAIGLAQANLDDQLADRTGYALAEDGLDAVLAEPGLNARQALCLILAAAAGVTLGQETGTVTILGGNVLTTRIQAVCDANGNRTQVMLALPF